MVVEGQWCELEGTLDDAEPFGSEIVGSDRGNKITTRLSTSSQNQIDSRSLKFLVCDWVETIFLAPHHLSMAENTAFSSSGQDIISRPVEIDEGELQLTQNLTKAQLAEFYDIDRIVGEILSNDFKRVRHYGLRI